MTPTFGLLDKGAPCAERTTAMLQEAAAEYERVHRKERAWRTLIMLIDEQRQESSITLGHIIGAETWTEHPSAPKDRR
jgi:hypothetical protein